MKLKHYVWAALALAALLAAVDIAFPSDDDFLALVERLEAQNAAARAPDPFDAGNARHLSYGEGMAESKATGKPLAVFISTTPRAVPGFVVARVGQLHYAPGTENDVCYASPAVIVAVPDPAAGNSPKFLNALSCRATDAELRAEADRVWSHLRTYAQPAPPVRYYQPAMFRGAASCGAGG